MRIVLTGANRGIGLALSQKFIQEGHEVTALCRKSSSKLDKSGATVMTGVDVTDEGALEKAAQKVSKPVDILISNAGLLISDDFESFDFSSLEQQVEVNTYGPLKLIKAFQSHLKEGSTYGILTSRMGSIADNTSGGQYGYRLSKAAANAVGKSLAEDFKTRQVTVLLLHPGYVKTDMTGGNGLIETNESANGLYQILMDKKLYQTGTFWHTNGEQLPW